MSELTTRRLRRLLVTCQRGLLAWLTVVGLLGVVGAGLVGLVGAAIIGPGLSGQPCQAQATAQFDIASERLIRMSRVVQYLASDELEGRGLSTAGLQQAADFIREDFRSNGLELWPAESQGQQPFEIATSAKLIPGSELALGEHLLKCDEDFTPLALSDSGHFACGLAFVGYGITAPELTYDDYQGIDINGQIVIVLRHEPRQDDPDSPFDGRRVSRYAPIRTKISMAYQHGAAGVIVVTDAAKIAREEQKVADRIAKLERQIKESRSRLTEVAEAQPEQREKQEDQVNQLLKTLNRWQDRAKRAPDGLFAFSYAGTSAPHKDFMVMHCTRNAIDRVLESAGHPELAELEEKIDEHLQPQSFSLTEVMAKGQFCIERTSRPVCNVIGIVPGRGQLSDQAIVVGAHYDHLGRGEAGTASKSKAIHNGADDNASGVAALMEMARALTRTQAASQRELIFVAFTGEERGLLGSAYFLANPPVPSDRMVAMINFDMVGRLRDNKLLVQGFDTAQPFEHWLDHCNEQFGFEIVKRSGGMGPSDHANFYAAKIPVLHFFTGLHDDYHKPEDDFELLDLEGMQRITEYTIEVLRQMATYPQPIRIE